MALEIRDLSITLGKQLVIDRLTATLSPGKVTVVLGANGAGKSTLLRCIAALVPWHSGAITLDGVGIAHIQPRERARQIGYLPQDAAVHWNMQVRDLIALGRLPHGDAGAAEIDAAMVATNTAQFAHRPVRDLSGGERARVLMARVLAGAPRWILADEPLASLDPLHQLETLALLRDAAARGIGVVTVLHDLTHAARVADHILLLHQGRLLAQGTPGEVLTPENLATAYGVRVALIPHLGETAILPLAPT